MPTASRRAPGFPILCEGRGCEKVAQILLATVPLCAAHWLLAANYLGEGPDAWKSITEERVRLVLENVG
jgi:hypothetical protein